MPRYPRNLAPMRLLALILFLLAPLGLSAADRTNYICLVCGKGPLTNHLWLSKWGPICDDCYKIEKKCSLCGLPVREGDGCVKTGDGRYICRFDKKHAVMDVNQARELFADVRGELIGLFGSRFRLNNPEVTVNLFDVDYWSENVHTDGLHKFGFSNSRRNGPDEFTHEVVLLSGRLDEELSATMAHEYTHLWINENRAPGRELARDTIEGLCELVAYKLMESHSNQEMQKLILGNPYTHGETQRLVDIEAEYGINFILNWVANGTTARLDPKSVIVTTLLPWMTASNVPPTTPSGLKLGGIIMGGTATALINGLSFSPGELHTVKLKDMSVQVHCLQITTTNVVLEVNGYPSNIVLKVGEEKTDL
jgi:hypothetical protein